MDEDIFDEVARDRTALVLIRASFLRNLVRFTPPRNWQIINLTTPGWRSSDQTVQQKLLK
jgi:hypothetical protein